jgi:hypothetical protein
MYEETEEAVKACIKAVDDLVAFNEEARRFLMSNTNENISQGVDLQSPAEPSQTLPTAR